MWNNLRTKQKTQMYSWANVRETLFGRAMLMSPEFWVATSIDDEHVIQVQASAAVQIDNL